MNPFRKLYRLAINSAAAACDRVAYGLAANISADPVGKGEWMKLCPWFEGEYAQDGKRFRQVVQRRHGDRMVTAFNSLKTAMGANFRGLPIYRGHPDADHKRWPDERRLGDVLDMEAREDGLYVQTAWNDEGERNRAQGYLVYPSPAWNYDEREGLRTGRIEPTDLQSIGMTNQPRVRLVPAWTNADPISDQPPTTKTDTDMNLKALLLKLLKLPDTATDAEIQSACDTAQKTHDEMPATLAAAKAKADGAEGKAVAANSDRDAATRERDLAKADAEKFRKLAINAHITAAINAGKITAAEQPSFETKLATNFDDGLRELTEKKPALPTDALKITQRTGDISTPAGRKLAFNTALDAHLAKGLGYDAAIDAMRATPDEAALLTAMQAAK